MKDYPMQEFENWWERNQDNYNAIYCATREGWQAALEWVLKNCPLTHTGREKIQEELEEE